MTKRAVLYARVSSDDRSKEGRNLTGQLDMGRKYAQEHGYTVVAELAEDDRGASGAEIDLPQLNRVRGMARAGEFDVLVVREIDRLSRNLAKQLIVEQELKGAGVSIEYVLGEYPDTPEGNFQKHVKAAVAEYEREKITERNTRGRRLKVEQGNVMTHGQSPYGYRLAEAGGKQTLEVFEPEARVIRMMFDWYTVGDGEQGPMSFRAIARRLTEMGIQTHADLRINAGARHKKKRRAGEWAVSSVSWLIRNEVYAGVWRYGKRRKDKPSIGVEVPAIVSRETWEAAQARRAQNKRDSRRNLKREYLLRRRAFCECGYKMIAQAKTTGGKVYLYYRCSDSIGATALPACKSPHFRADHVDAVVWDWIKSFLTDPATLTEGLEAQREEREKANEPLRDRLAVADSLLADNRRQLERLLDLYLSGDFDKEMLTERKARLETTIGALERERADLVARLDAKTLTDEQIQTITDLAERVKRRLPALDESFEARRRLIELLDVWVTLAVEDGKKIVYARCLLGESTLCIVSTNIGTVRRATPG